MNELIEHFYIMSMSTLCDCAVSLITIALIFLLHEHFTIGMYIHLISVLSHSLDDNLDIDIMVDHYMDYRAKIIYISFQSSDSFNLAFL